MLDVFVLAASALRVQPSKLELRPREIRTVAVFADGVPVSPQALRWNTTDPNIVVGQDLAVAAGKKEGSATANVIVGSAMAGVQVVVRSVSSVKPVIQPTRAKLSVGSVQQMRLSSAPAAAVTWETNDPAVLLHLHDGLFLGRSTGVARACAVGSGERLCARIEVVR